MRQAKHFFRHSSCRILSRCCEADLKIGWQRIGTKSVRLSHQITGYPRRSDDVELSRIATPSASKSCKFLLRR